ncbi:MAG: terpene cyclase/mutase family protein [Candidatus Marinimicrobia bacterium]|nr:terpene cyclase/mutase family protein [Candidatus Neomarinimicrobiota bacterium]
MAQIKDFSQILPTDPLPLLFNKAPVHLQYRAIKYFDPENKKVLGALQKRRKSNKRRNKLFKNQREDGSWELDTNYKIEKKKNAMLFLKQLQNLTELLYLGENPRSETIKNALIRLIKFQKEDGKFPLAHHHQGYALWLLAQYGLAGNPIVEKGYRWLIKRQKKDGGWISPLMKLSEEVSGDVTSCLWTSIIITEAFSSHSRLKNSDTTRKAANFIADHYLYKNHTSLFPEPDAWDYLHTDHTENGMFRGGTLRFCEALAPLEYMHENKNFQKAIKWLKNNQLDNGLFPAKANNPDKGDYHVTFRVLKVLDKIQ